MQNRFASLFIAALLPLLLFHWFVPMPIGQLDFWLMWVVAMLVIGLPLLYAEVGLAHRSQNTPAQGIQELTRQADTSTIWRSFVWLTVLMSLVIAGLGIDAISANVLEALRELGINFEVPSYALAIVLMVIAALLSLLGASSLIVSLVLIAIAFAIGAVTHLSSLALVMTEPTLSEWARAVTLALVSVGVGTGLYWFNNPLVSKDPNHSAEVGRNTKEIATKTVLPIWLTQLVIGSIALMFSTFSTGALTPIPAIIYALGVLAAAAYFIYYASAQIATKFGRFGIGIATAVSMIIGILLVLVATPQALVIILVVLSIVSALVLAIFSGWQMKISHMRKSLNFKSEGIYNVWRAVIRILVPLLIVIAVVGWFLS